MIGGLSHALRKAGSLDKSLTLAFFSERYRKGDATVFDCRTENYCEPLIAALPDWGTDVIVDLGCGDGALYSCLTSEHTAPIDYIGLDFAVAERQIGPTAVIVPSDIRDPPPNAVEERRSRTLTCVNSICYVERVSDVRLLADASRFGDACFILEPYPSWFWDYSFDDIKPRYRYPKDLANELRCLDWNIVDVQAHYIFATRFFRFFPVSYLIVSQKR